MGKIATAGLAGATTGRRSGIGTAPGTFGELLQGALPGAGRHFMVTLPIMRGSEAEFHHHPDVTEVRVLPADRTKSARLAAAALGHLGVSGGGTLILRGQLPMGKGMASSSADLVATARAVAAATGRRLEQHEVEGLLRRIEPSDGVMYPGSVAFYHREVRLRARLGPLPPLTVIGVDEGGEVDTVDFNRTPHRFSTDDQGAYARMLDALTSAVRVGDVAGIGQVASASALRNQGVCPKRTLKQMLEICAQVGGAGVAAAHSGTVLGILLDERDPRYRNRLDSARLLCSALGTVSIDHSDRPKPEAGPEG